jgi:glycosyltransferase involved in cell wall biosynthesis
MSKISIVFPTRNRPDNVRRLYTSVMETSQTMPEIYVYIDDDDTITPPVCKELGIRYMTGPRMRKMASCFNELAQSAVGDILMYIGDDFIFRTKHWDVSVLDAFSKFPDKILLAYPNDGGWGEQLATAGFLHRNWINAVGYLFPIDFFQWADNWLQALADGVGRRVYLGSVLIEHMHPTWGKAAMDATYQEADHNDDQHYVQTASNRQADIEKLRAAIQNGAVA